ncbi:MAG: hypothetical protein Q8R18_05000 [bacterium]|nr:hypothetical protein [bacterium]
MQDYKKILNFPIGVSALSIGLVATQAYAQEGTNSCQDAVAIEVCEDSNTNGLCDGQEKKHTTAWQEVSQLLYGDFKGYDEELKKQRELALQFTKPQGTVYNCTWLRSPESLRTSIENSDTEYVTLRKDKENKVIGFALHQEANRDGIYLDNIALVYVPKKHIELLQPTLLENEGKDNYIARKEFFQYLEEQRKRDCVQDHAIADLESQVFDAVHLALRPDCGPYLQPIKEEKKKDIQGHFSLGTSIMTFREENTVSDPALLGGGMRVEGDVRIPIDEKNSVYVDLRPSRLYTGEYDDDSGEFFVKDLDLSAGYERKLSEEFALRVGANVDVRDTDASYAGVSADINTAVVGPELGFTYTKGKVTLDGYTSFGLGENSTDVDSPGFSATQDTVFQFKPGLDLNYKLSRRLSLGVSTQLENNYSTSTVQIGDSVLRDSSQFTIGPNFQLRITDSMSLIGGANYSLMGTSIEGRNLSGLESYVGLQFDF